MSATACNTCHELITFVLNANGRWRPVDVTYTVVELDGDELLAVQEDGAWRQTNGKTLRVYRAHSCPENPEWNRGAARTRRVTEDDDVDKETGVIEPTPSDPSQGMRRGGYLPDHGSREYALNHGSYSPAVLAVVCPKCHALPGDPCSNDLRYAVTQPHTQRNWVVAFSETEHWPPKRNQKGYRAMRLWLYENADIFALPTEGETQ